MIVKLMVASSEAHKASQVYSVRRNISLDWAVWLTRDGSTTGESGIMRQLLVGFSIWAYVERVFVVIRSGCLLIPLSSSSSSSLLAPTRWPVIRLAVDKLNQEPARTETIVLSWAYNSSERQPMPNQINFTLFALSGLLVSLMYFYRAV